MNIKLRKTVFALSENSRITTKELGKFLKVSQQSASYLVKQLKKKKIITEYTTIVDPSMLGFTNILVGINFLRFDDESQKEALTILKKSEGVISISEASQGVDLTIEFCVPNLSAFNKTHIEISQKLSTNIETKFILPVVVKHLHNKTYLTRKKRTDKVIHGDREITKLNENENKVLKELIKSPKVSYAALSQKLKLSTKSILNIKRRLEHKKIIRGYSCVFNHQKLGVDKYRILLNIAPEGIIQVNKITSYIANHKNCVEQIKLIGEYQMLVTVETLKPISLIKELRSNFPIKDYKLIKIDKVLFKQYVPENF